MAAAAGHHLRIFTYGRLRPLHVNGMLFGWLLAAEWAWPTTLCRGCAASSCGARSWAWPRRILWNIIILGAVVTLLGGYQQGLGVRRAAHARRRPGSDCLGDVRHQHLCHHRHPQVRADVRLASGTSWAPSCGPRSFISPATSPCCFTTGVNQANLNWMYMHNAVGLIFTPIGLAVAYYFIPSASNTPLYSHKLSMVGFWSLAFVYVWTGAHHMLHGPISQWLQTIAIVFSLMLLIPVWAVVYNFFATMKGQWHQLRDNVPLKFLMSGVVFYLLTCFQGPMHSLRSVNAIVSKTDWIPGHAHMALLGCFSFFAIAGVYYVVPRMFRHQAALRRAGQLELLVLHDRRPGLLRHSVAGRLLAGLAVEQSVDPVHRHGGRAEAGLDGALLLRDPDLLRNRAVRLQHLATVMDAARPSPSRRARRRKENAMLGKTDNKRSVLRGRRPGACSSSAAC